MVTLLEYITESQKLTLKIKASAHVDTFETVAIPTENGFEPGAVESFLTKVKVYAYKHSPILGLFGIERLIEKKTFKNAALEFGGSYRCDE